MIKNVNEETMQFPFVWRVIHVLDISALRACYVILKYGESISLFGIEAFRVNLHNNLKHLGLTFMRGMGDLDLKESRSM